MEFNWSNFQSVLENWCAHDLTRSVGVRPAVWRKIKRVGVPVSGSSIYFDPGAVVDLLDISDPELRLSFTKDLCATLNEAFGSEAVTDSEAHALRQAFASDMKQFMDKACDDQACTSESSKMSSTRDSATSPALRISEDIPARTLPSLHVPAHSELYDKSNGPSGLITWHYPQYDHSRDDAYPMGSVKVDRIGGVLRYSWHDAKQGELYRVVASDREMPTDPDIYDTVEASTTTMVTDERSVNSAVRFISVWGYELLEDVPGGELGQCRLVAQGIYVHPLPDFQLHAVDGSVTGQYTKPIVPSGSEMKVSVKIARLEPGENVSNAIRVGSWLRMLLPDNGCGFLDGFQDTTVREGETYNYIAAVNVQIGAEELCSVPQHASLTLESAPIEKITDLTVQGEVTEGGNFCRAIWTAPNTGNVRIYRTSELPDPEAAARKEMPVSDLDRSGLTGETLVRIPSQRIPGEDGEGLMEIRGIAWPDGAEWEAAHFTPVTIRNEYATIGQSVTLRRAGGIRDARSIQRLEWQLISFCWPGEAETVELRLTQRGTAPHPDSPAQFSVSRKEYVDSGGFVVANSAIPAEGCAAHLQAVSYLNGKRVPGDPVNLDIPPLWGYGYSIKWPSFSSMRRLVGRPVAEINVSTYRGSCPPRSQRRAILVHNPKHLPLRKNDGFPLEVLTEKNGQAGITSFALPISGSVTMWFRVPQDGFVRLFVDSEPAVTLTSLENRSMHNADTAIENHALVDPDLTQLRVR